MFNKIIRKMDIFKETVPRVREKRLMFKNVVGEVPKIQVPKIGNPKRVTDS